MRDNCKAGTFGITFEGFDLAVTDGVVISISVARFDRSLVAEHIEDDDREFVSGGNDGLSFDDFGAYATMVSPEGGVGTQERNAG